LAQTVYINTNIHYHFVELCYSSLSFSTELKDQIIHAVKSVNVDRTTVTISPFKDKAQTTLFKDPVHTTL